MKLGFLVGVLLLFLLSTNALAQESDESCKEQGKTVVASDVCGNGIGSSYPGPSGDPTGHCQLVDCCGWYQTDHIHDLGKIVSGDLVIEYSPGFTEGCNDTVLVDVSPDQVNWTPVASFPTTTVDTCPPNQCWKHYLKKIHNVKNFRYVHIVIPNCYNDYSAAYVCGVEYLECPEGCECLTKAEAEKLGYKLCDENEIVCGETSTGETKYCWEKPECPENCVCLTMEEADKLGYKLCNDQMTFCGVSPENYSMYCFEKPEYLECPEGCECLTKAEAEKLGYKLCNDVETVCGETSTGETKYCWEKITATPTPVQTCPEGCVCLPEKEMVEVLSREEYAAKYGVELPLKVITVLKYKYCNDKKVICGETSTGETKYCLEELKVKVPCSEECCCLTKEEAEKYKAELCNGVETLCGYDENQKPKYCYNVSLRVACLPTECICLGEKEAKEKGLERCHEGICDCLYGEPKYCYKRWPPCPEGCACLTEEEANEEGWNLCEDVKTICGRTIHNKDKYCYKIPVSTPAPSPTITQIPCIGNFSVSISPKTAKLPSSGGNITYTFTINAPSDLEECINCTLYVKGQVSTTYPLGVICPPYPQTFNYTVNVPAVPAGTYTGTVVCQVCGQKRSDTTTLTIPGFEVFAAIAAVAVAYIILRRQ